MYFKLALRNVRKSFKDYLIYFLTIAFSICLFYTFNSFQAQQAVLEINAAQGDIFSGLQQVMSMLSIIVAFILAFLIIYANNFLIKRRKKELGLYTLLGMKKYKISLVLIYETFLIGLLSLIVGILAGLLASQLLTVMSANLFAVKLNYQFVFSMDATLTTLYSFAFIFFIIMIFNTLILNKYKLIDLLRAGQMHESLKFKNVYVSIVLFIASIALLSYAYYAALTNGIAAFALLNTIVPAGLLGTLLFFMSLSGFLLRFIQSSKSLYFKKLNMFVLRQINATINSNFLSMSIVCIMLLFAIGALATGLNLNATANNALKASTPYDFSYTSVYYPYDIKHIKEELEIDQSVIKDDFIVYNYESDRTLNDVFLYISKKNMDKLGMASQSAQTYEVVSLSSFNRIRNDMGLEPITLSQDEGYLFSTIDMFEDTIYDILEDKPTISLYTHDITLQNEEYDELHVATTLMSGSFIFGVVVNDNLIPNTAVINSSYWNADLIEGSDITAFASNIKQVIHQHNQESETYPYHAGSCVTKSEVEENTRGMSITFTYIGLYLGFVFLIASAVVLALQQLSQASDNRKRYELLRKIGTDDKTMNHSMLLQLGIYFTMPLLLAIVHSIVGIQTVNSMIEVLGKQTILIPSLITAGIIIVIYGAYFLITYVSYKRILKS